MIKSEYLDKAVQRVLEYSLVLAQKISPNKDSQITFRLGYNQALKDLEHFIRLWPGRPEERVVRGHSLYQTCEVEAFVFDVRHKLIDLQVKEPK